MKNLFLFPTDKQSVLYKLNKFDDEFFLKRDLKNVLNPLYLFYNIYITSYNQDINENDYIITKDGKLVQVSYLLSEDLQGASKVILTTDQKLINDDVQAIPDEFLKRFIKNPSCEEVEVKCYSKFNDGDFTDYKIIISKEEPKQETLGEVKPPIGKFIIDNAFSIQGADGAYYHYSEVCKLLRLQQEQDKNKFSEEVVELIANEMVNWAIDNIGNPFPQSGKKFDEVIAKFKNK